MDLEKIEFHIKEIIKALGEDPDREGLRETPERFARMCAENFAGIELSNAEIAKIYGKTFTQETFDDLVTVKDIEVFSFCEHHLALMYDMKVTVSYIPNGKILGLSKIARIAETAAKRLQVQERLGNDIAEIITLASGSPDVAVFISAKHSCMTTRGIKNTPALTITSTLRGRFKTDKDLLARLEVKPI
jgi:GTP cyclohydrolase I